MHINAYQCYFSRDEKFKKEEEEEKEKKTNWFALYSKHDHNFLPLSFVVH